MASLIERIFGKRNPNLTQPPVPQPVELSAHAKIEDLREHIRRDVASGFYDDDAVLTMASQAFEDEIETEVLRREAQRLLREALAEHATAQATWPARTDCDRLDDAFAALETSGVIARQNFTCCGTCGSTEIWDELAAARAAGESVRGYAFYHMQDTESAADGYGLFLNYGAVEEGEQPALEVARDIVAGLQAQGLQTDWNGNLSKRIGVSLEWRRRR